MKTKPEPGDILLSMTHSYLILSIGQKSVEIWNVNEKKKGFLQHFSVEKLKLIKLPKEFTLKDRSWFDPLLHP